MFRETLAVYTDNYAKRVGAIFESIESQEFSSTRCRHICDLVSKVLYV